MESEHYKDKKVVEIYNRDRFEKAPLRKRIFANLETKAIIKNVKKGNVLDVGCGTGRFSFLENYKGIDFSEEMIKKAKELNPNKEFVVGDAYNLPFKDNSFDNVICVRVMMHNPNWNKIVKELLRVCKLGGRIIFDVRRKGYLSLKIKIKNHKLNLVSLKDIKKYNPLKIINIPPIPKMTSFVILDKLLGNKKWK